MLQWSFSFVAAQLLVKKRRLHCRKANVAVQFLQHNFPKSAAQLLLFASGMLQGWGFGLAGMV